MDDQEHLTDKQRQYVQHLAAGMPSRLAARSAGYSESFSKVAAHRLGKRPNVAQAIASIRSEGRTMAIYDLATAMAEADAVCSFAKLHKNAMAYCKATELRAKLSGLLVDRVEIVPVDLCKALEAAEARVINVTPRVFNGALGLVTSGIDWRARIPGHPVANPEAGPAEDEPDTQVNHVGPES